MEINKNDYGNKDLNSFIKTIEDESECIRGTFLSRFIKSDQYDDLLMMTEQELEQVVIFGKFGMFNDSIQDCCKRYEIEGDPIKDKKIRKILVMQLKNHGLHPIDSCQSEYDKIIVNREKVRRIRKEEDEREVTNEEIENKLIEIQLLFLEFSQVHNIKLSSYNKDSLIILQRLCMKKFKFGLRTIGKYFGIEGNIITSAQNRENLYKNFFNHQINGRTNGKQK